MVYQMHMSFLVHTKVCGSMKQCQYCDWWDKTVPSMTFKGRGCKCSITGKTKLPGEGKYCRNYIFAKAEYERTQRETAEASQTSGK